MTNQLMERSTGAQASTAPRRTGPVTRELVTRMGLSTTRAPRICQRMTSNRDRVGDL
ncbi:hypothetical protein ABT247_21190 [Kitasatospora sp. NPDC001539]|uniref:hypothetical protein n=1 Tax=Kitasatospora sp. NPDC001539 TaxID=3154384 RepID=UPI00332B3476